MDIIGYGTRAADQPLVPVSFSREPMRPGEVTIAISHCGVCHSDLHQARGDWGNTIWPCVPGHEMVGKVTAVAEGVTRHAVGDRVGVGCMVNACMTCDRCVAGDEQYCEGPKSCTLSYNGPKIPDGTNSYGGYSTGIIVREEFVVNIPDVIEDQHAGPILCAGITVYQPMKHFGLKAGQRLGVAGIGGLGHMAVQIGKALGAHVVAFTRSADKTAHLKAMGADEVVVTTDADQSAAAAMSINLMIDTIPVPHDLDEYIAFMAPDSTLVSVGNITEFPAFSPGPLVFHRIAVAGSLIGGIADTQEVLDLCAEHGIRPEIEVVQMADIERVFDELASASSGTYRHVIDMAALHAAADELAATADHIPTPTRGEPVGRAA